MSAMLETYDMPMHDFQNDLDIQMHPSSDQWFPDSDEAQMEEDGPAVVMKPEIYSPPKAEGISQMKTDVYAEDKPEVTIEVDMEPFMEHHNVEYDMEDDEDIHHSGGETLDVEVYDVSLAQSPLMVSGEIVQDGSSTFIGSFEPTDAAGLSHKASPVISPTSGLAPLDPQIAENPLLDNITVADDVQTETHAFQLDPGTEVQAQAEVSELVVIHDHIVQSSETFSDSYPPEDPTRDDSLPTEVPNIISEPEVVLVAPSVQEDGAVEDDQAEAEPPTTTDNALGDPHEISEGVYIDPPPPVLLSMASEDHFDFSFFNESPDWNTPSRSDGESCQAGLVLLHHLPTLYYEPLSSVFDALRGEQYVQSLYHLTESELVLDAVDLQLTISEDNVYAREVTLHDLNILHDVSGINGLLRMRLHATAPRFITRYQYLQDHVSQLNLEPHVDVPLVEEASNEPEVFNEDIHNLHPEEVDATEEHIPDPVNTAEPFTEAHEQNNENEPHNEAESEGHTTESFDPETDLPPLPTEDNDEDELEEEVPLQPDNLHPSASRESDLHSELHATLQTENEQSSEEKSTMDDVVTLEALEAPPNHDDQSYGEEEQGEDEYHVEGEHTDHERREESSVGEYAEHEYHEQAEDEYVEDESAGNDLGDDYYPEDEANSLGQEEQLDYVEEANSTLETKIHQLPSNDPSEFDDVHPTVAENVSDEDLVASGSHHEEATNEQDTENDGVSISYPHTIEQENEDLGKIKETPTSQETATTNSAIETERRTLTEQDPHYEEGAELDNATYLELTTDPNLQETYTWEDDLDGEGDPETPLEGDNEDTPSHSNHSSVTLSSKASKRSFDDFEFDEGYENEENHWSPPSTPDPKRTRTH